MTTEIESQHFTQAVVELGTRRPVVASQAIYNAQGVKIVEAGTPVNASLYDRLMAHKLQAPIEQSLTAEGAVNGRSLRASVQEMLARRPFYDRLGTPAEHATWLDIIEKLPLPAPMALQLTLARELHPDQFDHALRAAWTLMWLVSGPLNLRFDLGMAAVAGLLHDIAVLHLDPALLNPKARLNRDQRRQLYSHPIISATLLERHHEYPKEVVRAVLEHHECDNGSGYPRNLQAAQMSPLGRALALTELVTAMVGGSHRGGELRLSVMLRMNMHRFDHALIARVMVQLRPDLDPGSHEVPQLDDPVQCLCDLGERVARWPADLESMPGLVPARREGLAIIRTQLAQQQRTLAEAGLTPAQLEQLGSADDDPLLPRELSLLAGEAAWQLRTLARQARRRWRAGAQEDYPPLLQQWLEPTEALCEQILGVIDAATDDHDD